MRLTPAIVEMFHKHCDETVVKSNLLCINIIARTIWKYLIALPRLCPIIIIIHFIGVVNSSYSSIFNSIVVL